MADFMTEPNELLELEEGPSMEELQDQVQRAQSELVELKRRQDQIEKEKLRLEELSRRQEELERGRLEMVDKLTRSLLLVQREAEESQRRLEQLHGIQDSFAEHLRELEHIDCKSWNGRELARELSRAIGMVDEAKAAYARAQSKIAPAEDPQFADGSNDYGDDFEMRGHGFFYWLQSGVAFTLPLVALGTIALLIWIWHLLTK